MRHRLAGAPVAFWCCGSDARIGQGKEGAMPRGGWSRGSRQGAGGGWAPAASVGGGARLAGQKGAVAAARWQGNAAVMASAARGRKRHGSGAR